ncbi:MAG: hypothetical protein NDJ92_19140 [Thermoanaerobaculia bacterium]|nr:hypothetical protein [Thermoanaerobaculia bacterium]
MNPLTHEFFFEAFNRLERHVEARYGIPVVLTDVPSPFTGDLDGEEIRVDFENDPEEALFILVHLFGHTVQWNVSERSREIGRQAISNPSEELLAELASYERDAARYSMALLHDARVEGLDQWLSEFSACDVAYLLHFYRTGEKRPFRSFWRKGAPTLDPLPLPEFHPTKWWSRWEGVVI